MQKITSRENSLFKQIKSLKQKKYRDKERCFFIEGIKLFQEALNKDVHISLLFLSYEFYYTQKNLKFLKELEKNDFKVFLVADNLFNELSDTKSPQGIMAVTNYFSEKIHIKLDSNLILILDSIQDPGNLGTIIRTADAAGFSQIILSNDCVDIYNPKVLRSTMGSIFNVDFYYSDNLSETIQYLKGKNIKIVGFSVIADNIYFNTDLSNNVAIILGNEANGVKKEILQLADTLVQIPMVGKSESLNVSIAASLIMYESLRQRFL